MGDPEYVLLTPEDEIRQILLRDWDPLRLNNDGVSRARYEKYVAPIAEILRGTRSKEGLIDLLHQAKVQDFAVIDFPQNRNRIAARKLLEIRIPENENQGS